MTPDSTPFFDPGLDVVDMFINISINMQLMFMVDTDGIATRASSGDIIYVAWDGDDFVVGSCPDVDDLPKQGVVCLCEYTDGADAACVVEALMDSLLSVCEEEACNCSGNGDCNG